MKRYHGKDTVKAGFYWNPAGWEIVTVPKDGGALPGAEDAVYVRLPLLLMMLAGPIMGALFVVFLPVLGFVMVFWLAARKLAAFARRLAGMPVGMRAVEDEAKR